MLIDAYKFDKFDNLEMNSIFDFLRNELYAPLFWYSIFTLFGFDAVLRGPKNIIFLAEVHYRMYDSLSEVGLHPPPYFPCYKGVDNFLK